LRFCEMRSVTISSSPPSKASNEEKAMKAVDLEQIYCSFRDTLCSVHQNLLLGRCAVNQCIRGCIQKFPDWPPGARTANGTVLCH
jgi:hypothetical protein